MNGSCASSIWSSHPGLIGGLDRCDDGDSDLFIIKWIIIPLNVLIVNYYLFESDGTFGFSSFYSLKNKEKCYANAIDGKQIINGLLFCHNIIL